MAKKPVKKSPAGAKNSASSGGETITDDTEHMTDVERWIEEIDVAKQANRQYWETVDKIVKKYKVADDDSTEKPKHREQRKYNVLWSIIQTMQPLVYAQPPQPHVNRKHNDRDPIARDASMVLQRSLSYELEGDELHDALCEARDDYLLGSRGVIWPKYKPYMQLRKSDDKKYVENGDDVPESAEVKEDEKGRYYHPDYEEKVYEEVDWEHVHYRDFLHGAASKWRHVPWVARRVPMTRKELVKRFGDLGKKVPLSIDCRKETKFSRGDESDAGKGIFAKGEVWEIWSKDDKKVYWLCPQYKKAFLDEQEDFLELDCFFPCPRPAYGTKTNESLIPQPDYIVWQDIALELDEVTHRIKLLTEALRVVGIYDKSLTNVVEGITKRANENDLIAVESYAMMQEKGGLKGAIEYFPIEQVAAVLDKMHNARQRLIAELYDITGISDIVRGASDPRETAKAQQIKGNFANKRLSSRQNEMLRMAREALEIQAQIICKHYSIDTIRMVSSAEQVLVNPMTQQPDPIRFGKAVMLLKNSPLRRFRVKINEKTLAMPDENDDREQRVQFVQGVSQLLGAATQMLETVPAAGPLLGEILLFAVRGFPMAKSTEASIEAALESLMGQPMPKPEEGGQPAGERPPTPEEMQLENGKLQLERERMMMDAQFKEKELALRERELAIKEKELLINAQIREREQLNKEQKTQADAQIRAAQVEQQGRAQQVQAQTNVMQFQAENERAEREMQHREQMDYVGAQRADREQQFNEQNAYTQAFAGGGSRR